jgi:tetratricopeptide (TPR) repeat protein
MNERVILRCHGSLEQGFEAAIEMRGGTSQVFTEAKGSLPAATELLQLLTAWQQHYRGSIRSTRILLESIATNTNTLAEGAKCRQLAKELQRSLTKWLASAQFQPIQQRLREMLGLEDSVEILLRTDDPRLHRLPWHLWDFIERYPQAELLIGSSAESIPQPSKFHHQVRILAILGDRQGIDIEADRLVIGDLPHAEVVFLVEPSREELHRNLLEKTWDVLFFAGHSNTEQQQGRIHLSAQESLTIDELRYGLQRAIKSGLKLAIFNSCDGLGLAYELEQLHIPHSVVMREPVPDRVALTFLKQFLGNFAGGIPLHTAVRQAREYLQGLEGEFPCASWLPIIFQNPALPSLNWTALQGGVKVKPLPIPKEYAKIKRLALSLYIASFVAISLTVLLSISTDFKAVDSLLIAAEKEKRGDYNGALNDYNQSILQSPTYSEAYKNRGILKYRYLNDISGAIADYSKAIELNPKSPYAYDHRGYLQANKLNNVRTALADFNKAIELDPKFFWAYYNRGVLKDRKLNDLAGALADYNRVIELNKNYVNAYYQRGVLRDKKLNDTTGALADYSKVIELDPGSVNTYHQRSLLRERLGDLAGAIEDQEEADKLIEGAFKA